VPRDASEIVARFQFVSPTSASQGRVVMAAQLLNLRWNNVALYPAGYYTRAIPVEAAASYPVGWTGVSALRIAREAAGVVYYQRTDFDTLVDSPVFAGAYVQSWPLGEGVMLNVVADNADELTATADQIARHAALVREADRLFGIRHFDHYDFLLAISDELSGIGIEHHRSSENGVDTGYFTGWAKGPGDRSLLPHEYVHSWNGKYRRPEGLWTPDFRTPTEDDLLWVYEGLTQLWGYVLAARSGLFSADDTRDALAAIFAAQDLRTGRRWRPLIDTTHDPIIAARRPKPWISWQRSEDYYNEGLLLWLEVDQIIRRESGGTRSLDDFARAFFAGRQGDWGVSTYDLDALIAALDKVQAHDWRGLFAARVYARNDPLPHDALTLGGYDLIYTDTPSAYVRGAEAELGGIDLTYSLGLSVENDGDVAQVIWDSPAFAAAITNGDQIVAVGGADFTVDRLRQAVVDSKRTGSIKLLVKKGKRYRETAISYSGGLRYPALRRIGEGPAGLDRLLAPQAPAPNP